mmetsp:Transcript_8553/g.12767  ORF Transcript_8553/g.12767 Transcript_8553/m.12767 type:complete len:307 (+) Transcript_8553:31-951(+)|eukprot:CAMPEP_0185017690 /NCGR_PEP_ID=MMETSP1103-20130426/605_1 /TAXON_ID=36769 /ORGANISM="Paraphysomonas bandaiensis, Strain Caron Lab Isolate" /LENGTH=306 /DNA_ID=CAMNT_0027547213 /DNA_START=31 /DNA_END=951 /DNA_ORIENTATION=+
MFTSCLPEDCAPFSSPSESVSISSSAENVSISADDELIHKVKQHQCSPPLTEDEQSIGTLTRFRKRYPRDTEAAYKEWSEWVQWRRDLQVDEITEQSISEEISSKQAFWHGKDKKNQPCLLVTGRLHDTGATLGSGKSFQKFMIYTVEQGCKISNESEVEKVCVLYDRRGLEYEHIDIFLYQNCRNIIYDLQRWYADKLGTIYILHMNSLFWMLYQFILRPIFGLLLGDKIVVVSNASDILEYFDEDELPPGFIQSGVVRPLPEEVGAEECPATDAGDVGQISDVVMKDMGSKESVVVSPRMDRDD